MAKKKKKGAKKKKAAAPPDPLLLQIKTYDLEKVNEERECLASRLKEVRRNRNFYMLERDAIQQYHYVVCQENEELKTKIRNLESEMEEMQRNHKDVIQIYLQKVTHLEYEHSHNLAMVDETRQKDLIKEKELFDKKKKELLELRGQVEAEFAEDERKNEILIKQKQEQNREALAAMRSSHEEENERLKKKYQARLQQFLADLELRRKIEIHEIEERKNGHINQLIENHEKNFNEMRAYYNSLTKDNLGLIKSLKDELNNLKLRQSQHEAAIQEYTSRNKELQNPKKQAKREVAELEEKLKNYQKDKTSLKHSRARAVNLEEILRKMRREHKNLEEKYRKISRECEDLYATFDDVLNCVKKKGEAANLKLEEKLKARSTVFAEKKAQFNELVKAADFDEAALEGLTTKLDENLTSKRTELKELRYENAKIEKAHDDLVRVYEAKLQSLGIPENELNARQLLNPKAHTAPADLIV